MKFYSGEDFRIPLAQQNIEAYFLVTDSGCLEYYN